MTQLPTGTSDASYIILPGRGYQQEKIVSIRTGNVWTFVVGNYITDFEFGTMNGGGSMNLKVYLKEFMAPLQKGLVYD